jgi:hypothetical protein
MDSYARGLALAVRMEALVREEGEGLRGVGTVARSVAGSSHTGSKRGESVEGWLGAAAGGMAVSDASGSPPVGA